MTESRQSDIAWAAGLFEGEGCFTSTRPNKAPTRYLRAVLAMTDEDVVLRFHRIVAIGTLRMRRDLPGKKRAWRWQTNSEDEFRALVQMFDPWLGERRRRRAYELLNDHGKIHAEQLRIG